ncbi:MAG: L,D-transpeptidase [Rhodospirillales bacterium]|nr:MAG: L,D-transpeptidase [Rhodospirillales bacterium]
MNNTARKVGAVAMASRTGLILMALMLAVSAIATTRAFANDVIGEMRVITAKHEDTLLELAREHGLGFVEMVAANPGVDPWVPGAGKRLRLPKLHVLPDAPRRGVVVNLAELRLYYFPPGGGRVQTFPMGIGRDDFITPKGATTVVRKQKHPTWYPTANTRRDRPELPAVVPPGPDNPLGDYALYLGWPAYLIHGTNMPYGVGRRVSRGCIRMYPEDIEYLFGRVPVGTPVMVVSQPVKLGRRDGELYMQVHPSARQVDQIEERGYADPEPVPEEADPDRILIAAADDVWRLDWTAINRALQARNGVAVRITRDPDTFGQRF